MPLYVDPEEIKSKKAKDGGALARERQAAGKDVDPDEIGRPYRHQSPRVAMLEGITYERITDKEEMDRVRAITTRGQGWDKYEEKEEAAAEKRAERAKARAEKDEAKAAEKAVKDVEREAAKQKRDEERAAEKAAKEEKKAAEAAAKKAKQEAEKAAEAAAKAAAKPAITKK